jgi:hypothetical protein
MFDSIAPLLAYFLRFLAVVVDCAAPCSDDGEEDGPVSGGEFAGDIWESYKLLSETRPF